jgi:hypothetical protein
MEWCSVKKKAQGQLYANEEEYIGETGRPLQTQSTNINATQKWEKYSSPT